MRFLVLSDLHANLQALEAVLTDARTVGYDQVLVLGDLVGYGADPAEVLARTLALEPALLIRGNHDIVCAGVRPPSTFHDAARDAIEWTRRQLTAEELNVLAGLPEGPLSPCAGVTVCHGAPFDEDWYILDLDSAEQAFEVMGERLCLFGHTHVACVFVLTPSGVRGAAAEGDFVLSADRPALINVGSVCQPRDGDPRAAYGVLDTSTWTMTFRRVTYDVARAQQRIRAAGLHAWLADRLAIGR